MCGIAGAIDLNGQRSFSSRRLAAMTSAIAHRGPDDEGFLFEPGLALGARRLAIIDLAGGRQPIGNEDGSVQVAFNGELFDYPQIRRDLLARGHQLKTRCDTETWVHLYEDFGERVFDHAKGQYAVSLWDRRSRTLILGRDRVGICPLYYYHAEREGWLIWGSEIKALLASGWLTPRVNPKGVDHLFSFFCAGASRTFFEGVSSIPPGHYLRVRDGRVELKMYWDLDFPDKGDERRSDDPKPLLDELDALLNRSIERRLRGDVPVVSYISGGLDSTVVLGLATRQRGEGVPSFTIGLGRGSGPDERVAASESAAALGSPLTMLPMRRREIADAFPDLVVAAEGPMADTSCACLMRLAERVHEQGYKVVLTGEGADEALAGYVWFKAQARRERLSSLLGAGPLALARALLLRMVGGRASSTPLQAVRGVRPAQQDMFEMIAPVRSTLYSREIRARLAGHDPYSDLAVDHPNLKRWHPLNQSLYVGYKTLLPGLLMIAKGDRIAMRSSVETRYPFLDEDVIEFCAGIDPNLKLRGRTEKWLLRQLAARTLPPQIANRPKTMFRSSLARTFLDGDRPSWVDQLLSPESLRAGGIFDPEGVARERRWQTSLPRITARRFVMDLGLACVVTTQLWRHMLCGGGLCDLPVWTPTVRTSTVPELVPALSQV